MGILKICPVCEVIFTSSLKHRIYCSEDCLKKKTREYQKKNAKRYYHKNADRLKEYAKKYMKNHPEYREKRVDFRKSELEHTIIQWFLDKYCEINETSLLRYRFFMDCFFEATKRFNHTISYQILAIHLKKIGVIQIGGSKVVQSQKKFNGIKFNKKGQKRFGISNISNMDIDPNISSGDAYRKISCNPGQKWIEDIYNNLDSYLKPLVDLDKTLFIFKQIETALFKKNKKRQSNVKIGTSLYVANKKTTGLSQISCGEIAGTTPVSIKQLITLLNIH